METAKLLNNLESMKDDRHNRRLRVKQGGSHKVSPAVDRNMRRWLNLFLSGKLQEGFTVRLFYHDEGTPFDTQTFDAITHNSQDEYLFWIRKSYLRRVGYSGQFHILAVVYDLEGSEYCRITIPVRGKVGKRLKYT